MIVSESRICLDMEYYIFNNRSSHDQTSLLQTGISQEIRGFIVACESVHHESIASATDGCMKEDTSRDCLSQNTSLLGRLPCVSAHTTNVDTLTISL